MMRRLLSAVNVEDAGFMLSLTLPCCLLASLHNRWERAENSVEFQEWANVGVAGAYALLCAVALVSPLSSKILQTGDPRVQF